METHPEAHAREDLDVFARTIHLGLMIFGILTFITSEWAEDYEHARHLGFTVHSWLGMGLTLSVALRLIYGLAGPSAVRFTHWVPYKKSRLLVVWEDIRTLLAFRLPDRPTHVGISGLVQTFGLLVFSWMGITGGLMFFYLKPGQETGGVLHIVEELHEIGEGLIPVFLCLHVGAVLLHAVFGRHIWRKMFFLKN
jgi:cytochrome b